MRKVLVNRLVKLTQEKSLVLAQSHTFVGIDHEIISTAILFLPLIQEEVLSVTSESMCVKYWLTALVNLTQEIKSRHDHSC